MRIKVVSLTLLAVIGMLVLSACGSVQNVASLLSEAPTQALAAAQQVVAEEPLQVVPLG